MRHLALAAALATAALLPHPHHAQAASPSATPPAGDVGPVDWGDPVAARKPTVADAKEYAYDVLGRHHYSCLNNIILRESHWNPLAHNRRSGAHGIPQALPGSKMRSAGSDWYDNPVTQVKWMIRYVNKRYGSSCNAWAFHSRNGWY